MKAMQELYDEIMGSDEKKRAFLEAAKDGKVKELLKAWGAEATEEQIKAFLQERSSQPLSDAELDGVAGGECNKATKGETALSIFTIGVGCAVSASVSYLHDTIGQDHGDYRLCNIEVK